MVVSFVAFALVLPRVKAETASRTTSSLATGQFLDLRLGTDRVELSYARWFDRGLWPSGEAAVSKASELGWIV
jgi:hypothetical protein